MKGAVGQFWLPEILGSSPRLEQDNEIARALYAAMRVSYAIGLTVLGDKGVDILRLASLMTLRFAPAEANHTAHTTPSSYNKTHHTPYMALHCGCGRGQMISALIRSVTCEENKSLITSSLPTRRTGFHTA